MTQTRTQDKQGFLERVADWYFTPREIERANDGALYKVLGVGAFKKVLPTKTIRYFKQDAKLIEGKESAKNWINFTKSAETIHLIGAGVFSCFMVNGIIDGEFDIAITALGINLGVNIYPIMLQRYNRARITNAFDRK